MNSGLAGHGHRARLFFVVKYATYLALLANVYLFLQEELRALEHTFTGALSLSLTETVQVFSATIDTAAWVILLLLFELETAILDDDRIVGWTKRSLHGVRMLCGLTIFWAFLGYGGELLTLYQVTWLPDFAGCAAAGDWSVLLRFDAYVPLDAQTCGRVEAGAYRISDFAVVADAQTLSGARYLAWTDVINAAAWILVVVVLEVEVRLQLRGRLTDAVVDGTRYLKYALYSTLFTAAVYWGFEGTFLDFWDACLWLFAFIFIELNVFDWQRDTHAVAAGA